ncbi:MAG: glycosyltransferase family 39 protein, partial [Chloroflexi bacterium]|nr:glycosyltransferase family 39 protein [Chloroflexota bacterium]
MPRPPDFRVFRRWNAAAVRLLMIRQAHHERGRSACPERAIPAHAEQASSAHPELVEGRADETPQGHAFPSPAAHADLLLAALLAVAFTALAAALLFLLPRPAIKYDAVEYQLLAESLARGDGFRLRPDDFPTAYRPPLYPALLALAFLLFGASVDVAYGLQAALHGLTVGVVYLLGREFLARRFALGAAVLTGLSVGLTCLVGFLMTETLQTLLVAAGALALVRWERGWSWHWAAAAGLLWGLALLAKGTNAALLGLWLAALLALRWRAWRRWALGVALLGGVLVLTLLPWTVRNTLRFGQPALVSTNIGIQVYVATLDPLTFDRSDPRMMRVVNEARALGLNEAATDRLFLRYGLERLAADPWTHLARAARNALRLWELPPRDALEYLKPTVMYNDLPEYRALVWLHYLTLALALAGLALAWRRRETTLLALWT